MSEAVASLHFARSSGLASQLVPPLRGSKKNITYLPRTYVLGYYLPPLRG